MTFRPRGSSSLSDTKEYSNGEDPRILDVAKQYEADWATGSRPDRNRYLSRYPDLARLLIDYLDGIDLLHQGAKALTGGAQGVFVPLDPGLKQGDRLGEFELVNEIGRGGMGIVYEARQTSLNRRVALKVLPTVFSADRTRLQRFIVEAQAAAAVVHPNIVPVYAFGEDRHIPYYAMKFVDGASLDLLAHHVAAETPFRRHAETQGGTPRTHNPNDPAAEPGPVLEVESGSMTEQLLELARGERTAYHRAVACIGSRVARALDHAHQCGVVHRDVKPANLLLDREGHAWVTDFGLAQFTDGPKVTYSGAAVGTLRYMSPEQAAGDRRRLDHRTDVYSLGVTLYELLTGRPAFTAESPPALLQQIASVDPPSPRSIDRALARELETIVVRAIQKDPGDRYVTAAQFADDLDRFIEGKPIAARRRGAWDRAKKWTGRHPGMLALVLACLLVVVLGNLVAVAWVAQQQKETRGAYVAKDQALQESRRAYEAANAMAEAERARAKEVEQRFSRAKELGDLVFRISEEEIGSTSPFQGPRRKLLLVALGTYKELAAVGHDPAMRAELDKLMERVKKLLDEMDLKREGEGAFLLFHTDVKTELNLTAEQSKKINDLAAAAARREAERPKGFGMGMGRPGGAPSLSPEARVDLIKGLTGAQRQRLRQIYVQYRGPSAFTELDVVDALDLTLAQRNHINELKNKGLNGVAMALSHLGKMGGMPQKMPNGYVDPGVKVLEQILEYLTPTQRETWRTLTGPPFQSGHRS